ncbi:tetratricopeptide repeat protein [Deinococcus sp. UR1]|uniref:tetratricopeptide repeat protein n=1 Tax=Deinococcus sp. UR1 TaxID=1704277 RepID=UPI000AC216D3|nr:tetratricopeptide repeat protein [Deinococcus sp. UR1]
MAAILPASQAIRDLQADRLLTQSRTQQQALEVDQAIDSQRAAVAINPRDARLHEALAESARTLWFFRRTDTLKAEADTAFANAKRLSPSWPKPHYEHARMYAFRQDYARGLTLLQGAIDRDPNNAAYWLERARYLELAGQTAQARGAYDRCLTLNRNVGECRDGLKALEGRP